MRDEARQPAQAVLRDVGRSLNKVRIGIAELTAAYSGWRQFVTSAHARGRIDQFTEQFGHIKKQSQNVEIRVNSADYQEVVLGGEAAVDLRTTVNGMNDALREASKHLQEETLGTWFMIYFFLAMSVVAAIFLLIRVVSN